MKGFIFLVIILPGITFANWNWSVKNSESYTAMTIEEIIKLTNQFPMILENSSYKPKDLSFVNVSETIFEWTGESVCEEGDENLQHYQLAYLACPKKDVTNCIIRIRELLSNQDPCL